MKATGNDNTSRNSTLELTPEEARRKRQYLLELARKEAEESAASRDSGELADASLATFILPGD